MSVFSQPFWGGKKHQVTADICAPNEKKPFCTVTGEWNGTMWAKYESGVRRRDREITKLRACFYRSGVNMCGRFREAHYILLDLTVGDYCTLL